MEWKQVVLASVVLITVAILAVVNSAALEVFLGALSGLTIRFLHHVYKGSQTEEIEE